MKITYERDGLNAKPPGGSNARDTSARVPIDGGYGASDADLQRGFKGGQPLDPRYPQEPEIWRIPVTDRHFAQRDWYDRGNPEHEALMRKLGLSEG